MSSEIVSAFIAFVGILISVAGSFAVAIRITNTELTKVRAELQKTYTNELLKARLKAYPRMYFLLSSFMKKLERESFTKSDIAALMRGVNAWNSRNALLFSGRSSFVSQPFRQYLVDLLKKTDAEFQASLDSGLILILMSKVGEFEVALKNDVGVFLVEFPDTPKKFRTYSEVDETLLEKNDG